MLVTRSERGVCIAAVEAINMYGDRLLSSTLFQRASAY